LIIRRITQTIFLILFIYLIIETSYPLNKSVETFINLSPLSVILTIISTKQWVSGFLMAIIILILTIFLGRFFCGWICPMGTNLDLSDKILFKKNPPGKNYNWKYMAFIALLILSVTGVSCGGWFDPICIINRSYSFVFYPYINLIITKCINQMYTIPFLTDTLRDIKDNLINLKILSLDQTIYERHEIILVSFILIIYLSVKGHRFWCRNLCPLGGMLGLFSSMTIYGRNVSGKCTGCNKCYVKCKMKAIDKGGKCTLDKECMRCFDCVYLCPEKAIKFSLKNPFKELIIKNEKPGTDKVKENADPEEVPDENEKNTGENPAKKTTPGNKDLRNEKNTINLTRREILTAGTIGIISIPLLELNYSQGKPYPFLLRPPGSAEEKEFKNLCISCGACMKVCPTNGLQPLLFEGGLDNLWTPKLVPKIGYCEYNCKLCSEVCPTGAIKAITLEEKQKIKIGNACIDRNRCINCLVCEEMCPVPEKAIKCKITEITDIDGVKKEIQVPQVVSDICIGCGICENKCPIQGIPAIYVTAVKRDA
jgi:polyferredoxin